jgi:hypothetical protein
MADPPRRPDRPGPWAVAIALAVMVPMVASVAWMLATSRPGPAVIVAAAAYVLAPAVLLWVLWQRWSLRENRRAQVLVVAGAAALLLALAIILFAVWP